MSSKHIKKEVVADILKPGELGVVINNHYYNGVVVAKGYANYTAVHLGGCSFLNLYYCWPIGFFERNYAVERLSEEDTVVLSNKKDNNE